MIGFAHRGAKAYAPENTIEAFELALKLGATGLESDVWRTIEGIPVLDHDGVVKRGLRRVAISQLRRDDLPGHIPTLADLLHRIPSDVPLSLDVKDESAFAAVIAVYDELRPASLELLYLCHPDHEVLRRERATSRNVRLVHSTRLASMKQGPERHAARLREAGIDVVNMPYPDWNGGLVALFARFGIQSFAWDCQHERQLAEVRRMRVDGVYSDWPDRIADMLRERA